MADVKWIQTEDYLVVIFPGSAPKTFEVGSEDFKKLKRALSSKSFKRARDIAFPEEKLIGNKKGVGINHEGSITIDGKVQDSIILEFIKRFKKEGKPFSPLVKLGKKISKIENDFVRSQLSTFLKKNKVSITSDGCFLAYKGVSRKSNGRLVDCRTGEMDNSVGMVVSMDREAVEQDPRVTCSSGLHVAALPYVNDLYDSSIKIICKVDPLDVVSVPDDYEHQKMRTCRYEVLGILSGNKEIEDSYVPWAGSGSTIKKVANSKVIKKSVASKKEENLVKSTSVRINTSKISARHIIQLTLFYTGVFITASTKNKQNVTKKALDAFSDMKDFKKHGSTITFTHEESFKIESLSATKIIVYIERVTGKKITISPSNKSRVVKKAKELLKESGLVW